MDAQDFSLTPPLPLALELADEGTAEAAEAVDKLLTLPGEVDSELD